MRKVYRTILSLTAAAGMFTACGDDKKDDPVIDPVVPVVEIMGADGGLAVAQEDTLVLRARVGSPTAFTVSWTVGGEEVSTDTLYAFVGGQLGEQTVSVTATNADGKTTAEATVNVHGKYKHGTFILSEGNMGRNTGFLTFIDERGRVTDSVYHRENGGFLGDVTQDLYIHNGKMYIISQNGGHEGGFLTVLDAETMKQERAYQSELEGQVSMPTHVAVLGDDDIYIRDNSGVKRFQPSTGTVTLIGGSEGATGQTMAVAEGKVFAAVGSNVAVIEAGQSSVSRTVDFPAKVTGVVKSSDDNVWVCCTDGTISKLDAQTYATQNKNVSEEAVGNLGAGWGHHTPNITAKGDTLYLCSTNQWSIYRYLFDTGETTLMVEDLRDAIGTASSWPSVYNTAAVHPVTGKLYVNVIEAYVLDPNNHIAVFDCGQTPATLSADHKGHTNCPAGIFFTYNFE